MVDDEMTFHQEARATQEQSNTGTSLLKLPAELRNAIYKEILPRTPYRGAHSLYYLPRIFHVSRQLRKEALPIYYNQSRFGFRPYDLKLATPWVESLASAMRSPLFAISVSKLR